jgi:hypothetical protein
MRGLGWATLAPNKMATNEFPFCRIKNWLAAVALSFLFFLPASLPAQTNSDQNLAKEEKEGCVRNLKVIYDAIQLYKADHRDFPNWLSDLVPQYLNDPGVLICPVCKRTGQIEMSGLADPKLPCSYLYEFCPVPLGTNDAPGDPGKTRRDWKERQVEMVGPVVPLVRCRHHGVVLNLAVDGHVYESGPSWEDLLTNRINVAELMSAHIFAGSNSASSTAAADLPKPRFPPRNPNTKPNLIDLSAYYNAALTESWHGNPDNDLSSLPTGVQSLGGVDYDVRGIIQLRSRANPTAHFPSRVNRIKIRQKCARLHFLHAAGFSKNIDDGRQIGVYIVHFATNQMQLEIPIVYGRDVRNWHKLRAEKPSPDLTVAWTGANGDSPDLRLFSTTWTNLAPDVEIESIDFVSSMGMPAPFLIAITAD